MKKRGDGMWATRFRKEKMCRWWRSKLSGQYLFPCEHGFGRGNVMVVHAVLIATMKDSILIGSAGTSNENITILCSGNGAANLATIKDGIVHGADSS